jgi:ketosteroid isomerase-like protein
VPPEAKPGPRELGLAFLERYCTGDMEGLAALLDEEVVVTGPRVSCASAAQYLARLGEDPPEPARFRVLGVDEEAHGVTVMWRLVKATGSRVIRQSFRARAGRIVETQLIFAETGERSDVDPPGPPAALRGRSDS